MPTRRLSSDQLEVALEPLLLIVEQRTDGAHVEDTEAGPHLGEYLRDDRKKRRLGLPASGRGEDHEVSPAQIPFDRRTLDVPQLSPTERVDDVVLQGWVEPVESVHASISMSSTD